MTDIQKNSIAARRCVELFNQKNIKYWVETCYAEKAEWIELPRPTTPKGQHGDRELLIRAHEQTLRFLPDREMEILNLIAQDDKVVLEIDWKGTTGEAFGSLPAGSTLHYCIATFLTFLDGLIIKEIDYCVPIQTENNNLS